MSSVMQDLSGVKKGLSGTQGRVRFTSHTHKQTLETTAVMRMITACEFLYDPAESEFTSSRLPDPRSIPALTTLRTA
jgi:hypothetical protein